jgi:4-hydroxy-tetrahydrodipicolinate synthase
VAIGGLVVPVPTVFGPDGAIDREGTQSYVHGLARDGVDHIFLLGTIGEFPSVEDDERAGLISAALAGLTGKTDLWVGVGAPATRRAVRFAKAAEEAGATALVATPPYYLHPTDAAIADYYRALRAATKRPLLAYNIPSRVGYALSPGLVHSLASSGTLQAMKDTSGTIESVRSYLDKRPMGFQVLPGDDVLATLSFRAGASGAVMGTANLVPRLAIELMRSLPSGLPARTNELQSLINALAALAADGPFPSTLKFLATNIRGAPSGHRAPYGPLTPAEETHVLKGLRPLRPRLSPYLSA